MFFVTYCSGSVMFSLVCNICSSDCCLQCFDAVGWGTLLNASLVDAKCIDFNEILHHDRDHQELVVVGPNRRPTNPRWRPIKN